jgi:predicted kinase
MIQNFKEPFVILLIGPPLSGKTTWINANFKDIDFELISRDQIVMDTHGSADYDLAFKEVDQKEVDKLLVEQLRLAGKSGKNVIIDMTNMNSKRRKFNLSHFGKEYTKYGVIFPILSQEEYLSRNQKRAQEEKKSIPMEVVKRMISSYETISQDEGFDKIITI